MREENMIDAREKWLDKLEDLCLTLKDARSWEQSNALDDIKTHARTVPEGCGSTTSTCAEYLPLHSYRKETMSINLAAVGLRVKPLEFEVYNRNLERATTVFGEYKISPTQGKRVFCDATFNSPNYRNYEVLADSVRIEATREVCQRHHEQQVLAQLEAVEAVPTEAMIDAYFRESLAAVINKKTIAKTIEAAHKDAP